MRRSERILSQFPLFLAASVSSNQTVLEGAGEPRVRGQAEAGCYGDTRHQVLVLNRVRSSNKELGQDVTQKQELPRPPTGDQEHERTGAPTWKWVDPRFIQTPESITINQRISN